MKLWRREFLRLACGGSALLGVSRRARAQAYPTRPVRWVVVTPAGGSPDIVARLMGQWLSGRLGQQFVIDNRPGAGGNIATEAVVRAEPDGYTMLLVTTANAISATLYDNLSFDFMRDITPVAGIMRVPNVLVVNPSVPAKALPELIAYAKANPGRINMASAGIGTTSHVSGELFKMMAGVDLVHVPFRGGAPALTDLLAGQVQVMFDSLPSSLPHIVGGELRPLAVTTVGRIALLPDVPSIAEVLPGYEASTWYGAGVPRRTPAEVVATLNAEINRGLNDPRLKPRLAELGGIMLAGSPPEFAELIAQETAKWARVVKFSGAKAG